MNRVLQNFGKVLKGRGIAAVFAVIATALIANALPVDEFGLVILLHTYIMVMKGFLNFRTYEAIVRFGIPLNDSGDRVGFSSLLRSTVIIDWLASLAAVLLAIAVIPLVAGLLHWDSPLIQWAPWYCLVLLTTPVNTGSGILRVYDRFDALGIHYMVGPFVRFVLVSIAWFADAGMGWFILAWGISFATGNLYLIARGFYELRAHSNASLWRGFSVRDLTDRGSEFWYFVGVVYWQTNVDLLPKHLSTLLAGSLLGPAAAGLFRLAREVSTVLTQPAILLREVLFPDLTRAWNQSDGTFSMLPIRTAFVAGAAGLALVLLAILAGESILALIGEGYVAAQTLMVLLLVAASFDLASASLRAAAYAMGKASSLLNIHFLGITLYLVSFYFLTRWVGLNGPGFAMMLASSVTLALTIRLLHREMSRSPVGDN